MMRLFVTSSLAFAGVVEALHAEGKQNQNRREETISRTGFVQVAESGGGGSVVCGKAEGGNTQHSFVQVGERSRPTTWKEGGNSGGMQTGFAQLKGQGHGKTEVTPPESGNGQTVTTK